MAVELLHEFLTWRDRPLHLISHSTSRLVGLMYGRRYPHKVILISQNSATVSSMAFCNLVANRGQNNVRSCQDCNSRNRSRTENFAGSRERCCAPRKTADSVLAQNPNSG